eukprot:gb/GECH01012920.1/.p1 GENE.gb/GECH01012920.1/~~gb/GECH01012920.1/.p1  ORF type:complete len:231 (+),score=45.98 gb/GECH01012920.1/:1-693(+)
MEAAQAYAPYARAETGTYYLINFLLDKKKPLHRDEAKELARPYYKGVNKIKRKGVYKFIWGIPRRFSIRNPEKSPFVFYDDYVRLKDQSPRKRKKPGRPKKRRNKTSSNESNNNTDTEIIWEISDNDSDHNMDNNDAKIRNSSRNNIHPNKLSDWTPNDVQVFLSFYAPRVGQELLNRIKEEEINGDNFIHFNDPLAVAEVFNIPFGIAMDITRIARKLRRKFNIHDKEN